MSDALQQLQPSLPKRYRLVQELRRGGMGVVYLARESHPDRDVAIKVLQTGLTERLGRERFLREVDFVSKFTHPHIVPIFAAGEAGGMLYYVMPFIVGETLGEHIARRGRLPFGTSFRIAREISGALEYAHQRNIIHRDIKPGNILIHEGHALVTDFGIARALSAAESDSITEGGVALGTASYMSPEQITGDAALDGRTDIYALGCVLYEMLAGKPAFRGTDSRSTLMKHVMQPPPAVTSERGDIPPSAEQVIQIALAKDPADRYQTAAEFSAALAAYSDQRASWSDQHGVRRPGRRGWFGLRIGHVTAAALALTLGAFAWRILPTRSGTLDATPSPWMDSVAVMPLVNRTGDARYDHLGNAVAELIINELTRIPTLKVPWLHSAEAYLESGLSARQLANQLGARHIITGSITLGSDGLHALAQHVDAQTGVTLWGADWGLEDGADFRSEQRVARDVVTRLLQVIDIEAPAAFDQRVLGPELEAYLLGQHWLSRRTADAIQRSISWFTQAIDANPDYAAAHAGLASAYVLSLTYRYRFGGDEYGAAARALTLLERGIQIDSNLAEAYATRGLLGTVTNRPTGATIADFERARAIKPNHPSVPSWFGRVLAIEGRVDEALAQARLGARLDPNSSGRYISLALRAFQGRDYDLTIEAADHAQSLEPDLMLPRAYKARALVLSGRAGACLDMDLGPHLALRALCLHAAGRTGEAHGVVDSVRTRLDDPNPIDSIYSDVSQLEDLASYFAWLGDARGALEWSERAFAQSPNGIDPVVLASELFDRVRDERAFADSLRALRAGIWDRIRGATPIP